MKASSIFSFSANHLKLLACVFMLIDHIGALLLPQYQILRWIGRLAFPIFAYMTANGYRHSSNIRRYLLRLGLFAIFYQPIFRICMGGHSNIFATLLFGLAAIYLYEEILKRSSHQILALLPALVLVVLAQIVHLDFGAYGVTMIFTAHLFYQQPAALSLAWLLCNGLYVSQSPQLWAQVYSLLAIPLLLCYNGKRGRGGKWFFYIFYCLHIPALYLIKELLL